MSDREPPAGYRPPPPDAPVLDGRYYFLESQAGYSGLVPQFRVMCRGPGRNTRILAEYSFLDDAVSIVDALRFHYRTAVWVT